MFSLNKAMVIAILIATVLIAGPVEEEKGADELLANIPIYTTQFYEQYIEAPAPGWDTNRVYAGSSSNLVRKVAIGQYFKGATDDTIRVVTVQSGGTRNLVIATDTTTTGFGKEKFRIEEPYMFSGGTPHPITVGDIDGDAYTDIVAAMSASPYRVIWFEWNGAAWAPQDSFAVNAAVYDLTIGDANNNGNANELLVPIYSSTGGYCVMHAVWTGTAWDTTRIVFSQPTYPRGAVIADIRPDLAGNEFYVCGTSAIGMAYWNGASWDTATVATGLSSTLYDITAGDVDGNLSGNEIAAVHSSSSYQISVWNWDGAAWQGRAWQWSTSSIGTYSSIDIGDILTDNSGNELVVAGSSSTQNPWAFWIAPNGSGWAAPLPKPVDGQTQYGVAIGNVNRFRTMNDEFVLTGYGTIVEVEQYDFVNDVGAYWASMHNPTSIYNLQDTITVAIFNSGSATQSGFSVGYRFQTNPATGSVTYAGTLTSGAIDSVKIPITMNFLGLDTLYVFTNLGGDANNANDTTVFHIEVYDDSTVAASGFNAVEFPPPGWTRTILNGTYNWDRVTSGTSPTCTPLEGYAMAYYRSFSASSGSQARLRTHAFNIGPTAKKVMLRFYMYGDPGYTTNPDSVVVEYSYDDATYIPVAAFHRYNAVAGWYVHDVEIGDFPANRDLYIGFLAKSGYGNNMFIDSVRIFTTQATAAATDAGIYSVAVFPPPVLVGDSLDVTVTIKNYGLNTLTSIPVFYTLGAADTTSATWTGSLQLNETEDFTFATKFVPADTGYQTLYCGTALPGDQDPANDTASTSFTVCPYSHTPPYTKDFNEDWSNSTNPPFCGWEIVDGGSETPPVVNNNDWHKYYYSTQGRDLARVYYYDGGYETHDDWLISPRLDCSREGDYELSYWHYYNDTDATPDSGRVLVTTDGAHWLMVAMYSGADDSGYKYHDISSIVSGQRDVKIAFHYSAYSEYYWYIDDFMLNFLADTIGPDITFASLQGNTYGPGPYGVSAVITDASGVLADSLYYVVDDIVTAVGHVSVSGDTFAYQMPTQTPGTVVEYYVSAVDSMANASTSERQSFWVLSPMAPTDLDAAGQADTTVMLTWLPPGEELSYHGAIAYYWYMFPGEMVATQFTPQHTPCKVEAASITFYNWTDSLIFYVWDDDGTGNPGTPLYVDTLVNTQVYPNPEIFDLSAADIVVSGDFHIGYEWVVDTFPCLLCDAGANTSRSKYNAGAWLPSGYDFFTTAVVSYVPPTAGSLVSTPWVSNTVVPVNTKRVGDDRDMPVNQRLVKVSVEPVDLTVEPGLLELILGISEFEVERSEVQGGPYTSIGTSAQSSFIDSMLVSESQYYYVVKANYTAPDTASYYSNEVTIAVDFTPPAYTNTTYDSLVAGPWVVSTDIADWSGLGYDSLAYRADGGAFTSITNDSVSGNTYYYTIPSYPSYTLIEFYLFSQDISWLQNTGRDPLTGYYGFTVTAVSENNLASPIPKHVFLSQNRPNPFGAMTRIEYGVPRSMHVDISVYNAAGQKVKTLVDEVKVPGYHFINWQGTDDLGRRLAEGVYFMRITTDDVKDTKKIIHVR